MRMIPGTPFVEVAVRSVSESVDEETLSVYADLKLPEPDGTFTEHPVRISLLGVSFYHDSVTAPGYMIISMTDGTALTVKGRAEVLDVLMVAIYGELEDAR
jgi:hypothetical protein